MLDEHPAMPLRPLPGTPLRRPTTLPTALVAALSVTLLSVPARAQLAPGEATIFRLAGNADLAMGSALAAGDFDGDGRIALAQESESMGHPVKNVVARRTSEPPKILIGAHYDSRMYADHDPDPANHTQPVPAANDGGSGVAVLLELARSLPKDAVPVWLVFFDAEDNGRIEGWDWILGSREFVKNNPIRPQAVFIGDMIEDADLNIYRERNSNPELTDEIWATAQRLGYGDKFIDAEKHSILDDHIPLSGGGHPCSGYH